MFSAWSFTNSCNVKLTISEFDMLAHKNDMLALSRDGRFQAEVNGFCDCLFYNKTNKTQSVWLLVTCQSAVLVPSGILCVVSVRAHVQFG